MKENRVLFVIGNLESGGIESIICNILLNIQKNIQPVLAVNTINYNSIFINQLKNAGIDVLVYGKKADSLSIYFNIWRLFKIIRNTGPYRAVHSNISFINGFVVFIAWCCGIKNRISHSHIAVKNTKIHTIKKLLNFILHYFILFFSSDFFACSQDAGKYVFGNKVNFKIIPNAINSKAYAFDINKRLRLRNTLKLEDKFVIGHVGRFDRSKNQDFIIDIFNNIHYEMPKAVLIFIGEGPLLNQVQNKVHSLQMDNCVNFLGVRNDLSDLYQIMDCFIFPSLHEGFGISVIEAQTAGLPCFISDGLPKEANIINTTVISLKDNAMQWSKSILEEIKFFKRKDESDIILKSGFDIRDVIKQVEKVYLK